MPSSTSTRTAFRAVSRATPHTCMSVVTDGTGHLGDITLGRSEVLYPDYKDDVVSLILKEPDHERTFAVALHVGH